MDVGNLAIDQSTGHDVWRGANRPRQPEDVMAFGVAPPAAVDWPAYYGLGEVWDRSAGAFEDDTMAADEGNRGSRGHLMTHQRSCFWRNLTSCKSAAGACGAAARPSRRTYSGRLRRAHAPASCICGLDRRFRFFTLAAQDRFRLRAAIYATCRRVPSFRTLLPFVRCKGHRLGSYRRIMIRPPS